MNRRASERLYDIALRNRTEAIDVTEIQELLADGADAMFKPVEYSHSTLLNLTDDHHTLGVIACLKTPGDIDFTLQRRYSRTFLHRICFYGFFSSDATAVLHAVVGHMHDHPGDIVDWGVEDTFEGYSWPSSRRTLICE